MKCPKCGFHSYAYDNCKKCGADLSVGKAKQGRHAVPPPSKKKKEKPLEKKELEQPAKTPAPVSEPTPEPPIAITSPPKPAKADAVAKLAAPPGKISFAAKLRAKFKPGNREEALPDENTLGKNTPDQVAHPEPALQSTPAPKTQPQPLHPAPVATPSPAKEVRLKPASSKRHAATALVETDTFAQGIDELPDIVSVTPASQELQQDQSSKEGEESGSFIHRAREGFEHLLARFSRGSDFENEVAPETEFSITEPSEEDDGHPPLPAKRLLHTTRSAPPHAPGAKRPVPVNSSADFIIDADIVPLNPPPGGANKRPALPAGNALPPLPTTYNSPPPASFTTNNSLPSLSSEGDLPPLPAASVLPTIITATIEEKKHLPPKPMT